MGYFDYINKMFEPVVVTDSNKKEYYYALISALNGKIDSLSGEIFFNNSPFTMKNKNNVERNIVLLNNELLSGDNILFDPINNFTLSKKLFENIFLVEYARNNLDNGQTPSYSFQSESSQFNLSIEYRDIVRMGFGVDEMYIGNRKNIYLDGRIKYNKCLQFIMMINQLLGLNYDLSSFDIEIETKK